MVDIQLSRGGNSVVRCGVCAAALLLGGCGGGGGVKPSPPPPVAAPLPAPTSAPTPAPTPSPTPTGTGTNFDTSEYRATVGSVSMNALSAYNKGATGAGVGVGVIDSGIDLQSEEFGDRLSAASRDVAGNSTVDDESGHGTAVAFTIAGRRNGAGTHGVAFDATIIALRADRPGTCAAETTNDEMSGCKFPSDAIARGVDAARVAGAKVINLSLGGEAMPADLRAAIGRATAAGIVLVIAAGNDGTAEPDPFALVATDTSVSRNQVIIAGSVGAGDIASSFSDKAGSGARQFLTAVGERVRAPDESGTSFLWSGTSFAAPQISGAVALLAQAFPNLTGAQIVELLLTTARDAGEMGTDPVYGRGVLDLTRAFQPVGVTSVAGTGATVSMTNNGTLSAPMGDARTSGTGAVILDGFNRAFAIDLAQTIDRHTPAPALANALGGRVRSVALATGGMTVALTVAPSTSQGVQLRRAELTASDASAARAIAGLVTQRFGTKASFGVGFAMGGQALSAHLAGRTEPAFLIAGSGGLGFYNRAGNAAAYRQQLGQVGLTAALESGRVSSRTLRDQMPEGEWARSDYHQVALTLDRRFGSVATSITGRRLAEASTLLGARLGGSLGAPSGTSWFVDLDVRAPVGGWLLGGSVKQGWTAARLSGIDGGGQLRSVAWSADLSKTDLWTAGDSFGLRLAQPLRVTHGGLSLVLPTHWNYGTGAVDVWTKQTLNLAPTGRELDLEARYALPLILGDLQASLFWRRQPGHVVNSLDDKGVAVRWETGF